MLRINQFAKEMGVPNQEIIDLLEKRLGVTGKSHSSNLSEEQAQQLKRALEGRGRGEEEGAPLARHKPTANVKVVKTAPKPPEPAPEPPAPPKPAPILLKKAEHRPVEPPPAAVEAALPPSPAPVTAEPPPVAAAPEPPAPEPAPAALPVETPMEPAAATPAFSRLRISEAAAPAPKPQEPARYIQLPPQAPAKGKPEPGAKPMVQRPGPSSQIQRSGMPQPEKTVLPMATNTGKGEVMKHEALPPVTSKRLSALPSIADLRPDQGFSRIKMADAPIPVARPQQPPRYIQLPQQRPGPGARPGGPGARPGGPGRPGMGPRPGGPGRPGMGPRPGGPGRPGMGRPGTGPTPGPIDPNASKGPGRTAQHGKKKGKHERRDKEELELKLRQPRSRAQMVAAEFVQDEIGIVMLSEGVSVKELAEKCNRPAKDVMAKLLHRGIFATINQPLDPELAKEIAREFGFLADIVSFEEDVQLIAEEDSTIQGEKLPRPPVVTIMGHVDHGKTSLLDAIRTTKVAAGEAGGITQHIGAYHVDLPPSGDRKETRSIVFLDTPGHEAFTKMRARGAKVTDIVVLVVAADDGVMPQTVEAINHAKAAEVPLVVAINKVDKPGADPDRVQQMLLQHSVQTESFGGEVPSVKVSAKTRVGLDELLETLLLMADLKDLRAVYDCPAAGSTIEAQLDRGRGPVATVLVQSGTLKAGDVFVAGATMGKVRAMFDDRGQRITEALPSMAVQILGFEEVPASGDNFQVVEDDAKARQIVSFRQEKAKAAALAKQRVTLENLFATLKEGQIKELPLIIKGDTQGSVESIVGTLERLGTEKVRVRIIHAAAGTVTENDVLLAEASKATIIAFQVKAERGAEELAQEEGVDLRFHQIIYKVTEEIGAAMLGLLEAIVKETVQGQGEVRQLFKVGKTVIAGSFITEGKVQKPYLVRVKRGENLLWEGSLKSLKRYKEDVHEVKNGLDCGISLEGFDDLKEGDVLEFFIREKVAATSLG